MKHRLFVLAGLALADPALVIAQQPSQAPPTWESMMTRVWRGTHEKILEMAKDLPEDKLASKPHPDSRTALEELRHVTIGLEMSTAELKSEKFDYAGRTKADETKPQTRASVVSDMQAAFTASMEAVEKGPKPRLLWWSEHQGEHYGKLVTIYRMNGLVPPASRPRPKS